jgi:REP element-mobilizing transposase RayT
VIGDRSGAPCASGGFCPDTRPFQYTILPGTLAHMPVPLAYFLTWSCYGTRLHGDERGTVDDDHNEFDSPPLPTNSARRAYEEELLRTTPVILTDDMRIAVSSVIRRHCEIRGWVIHALNVRTTHVHVVLGAEEDPHKIEGQLKAWATRRLRKSGLAGADTPIWTRRGSTRYLWDQTSLVNTVDYVMNEQ